MSDVKINKSEYEKMQRELAKLYALEAGGVDNWEWFDESLKDWRKENEMDELLDKYVDALNDILVDAEVEEPAARGAGYSINIGEDDFKDLLKKFFNEAQEIQGSDD